VFSSNDLLDSNVIKLNGPLLRTRLYNAFITNGSVPILLTSISFFSSLTSDFEKIYVGKFNGQKAYSDYVYGLGTTSTLALGNNYSNPFKYEFSPIILEYWFYNGSNWQFDSERVGGSDDKWYTTYKDNAGNSYYQHLFEFPQILIPYVNDYSISKYAGGKGGKGGSNSMRKKQYNAAMEDLQYNAPMEDLQYNAPMEDLLF